MSANRDDADDRAAEVESEGELGQWVAAVRELLLVGDRAWQALACQAGLGRTDVIVLEQLHSTARAVGAAEIRERTGLTAAAVTSLTDRLEQRDLARRVRSVRDRRVVLVELTDAGRELSDAVFAPLRDLLAQDVAPSPQGELPELVVRVRCVNHTAALLEQATRAASSAGVAAP